jgi:hypothetical protein
MQRFQNFSQQDILIPFKVNFEMWEEPWIYNRENSRQHDREPISSLLRDGFISHQPPVPLKDDFNVFLYLNGNSIARSHVNEITNNKKVFGELMETFTMQAMLNLKAEDQIGG